MKKGLSPFHTTGLSRYPLKNLENVWFSDVFMGYRKRPVAGNGLMGFYGFWVNCFCKDRQKIP